MLRELISGWLAVALLAAAIQAFAAAAALGEEQPKAPADVDQQIAKLIEQLGDRDYFVRERAQAELAKLSFRAFDALTAATSDEDLEIAARARYLLGLLRMEWVAKDSPPEVQRLLADYELQNDQMKLARIRAIARLPDAKGVPALCRLVRFEKSPLLSKQAAVELLEALSREGPPTEDLARQLRDNLGTSHRPGALWLMTRLRFDSDPQAALAEWTKLVEAEHELLQRSPAETNAAIVARLVRWQVQWLKTLNQTDQVMAAMRRLVDLEQGNPQTLAELLDWLIQQRAWKLVDELAARFGPQFAANPLLLYASAQAQAEQGNHQRAEQSVQQALRLNPGKQTPQLRLHYDTARTLQQRGRLQWAEGEYRHVIDAGDPGTAVVASAQYILAEMLHDQSKDQQAASMLQALLDGLGKRPEAAVADFSLTPIRSRMYYFFACHFDQQKDPAKQRQYLDKALAADRTDIDVLIACYRIAEQGSPYRQKILRLIKDETARLRDEIDAGAAPGGAIDSTPYNQLAWLVGNTEGDFEEALRCSQKSIEITPDFGGYYDTLAHVYFGKGDYENAFKTQTKAAELEPHSGLIIQKLEVFRKKWEETKAKQQQSK